MIIIEYTKFPFTHTGNDFGNVFSLLSSKVQWWRGSDKYRFKWHNKEKLTLNISSTDESANGDKYSATRFKIWNDSGIDRNVYYYFVDSVIKNNDGSVVIDLSLDYFLTYHRDIMFGNSTSHWFGASNSIPFMVERSHLMPDPSSFIGILQNGYYERMINWNKYVLLLQTLKRVDFDIAGYINEVIYSNKNFLQVAVGNTNSKIASLSVQNNYGLLDFTWEVPWVGANNVGDTGITGKSQANIYISKTQDLRNYSFNYNDLITPFNSTSTWIVMPWPDNGNVYVRQFSSHSDRSVLFTDSNLQGNINIVRGSVFIIPAPANSLIYQAYLTGAFTGTGAILIDFPFPHPAMLVNKCYKLTTSSNRIDANINIGMYHLNGSRGIDWAYGVIISNPLFTIDNLLSDVLGSSRQGDGLSSVENKTGMNKWVTYQDWRNFIISYTANQDTTDFFLLKGLNSIYFTFKQGYLCFSFHDYNTFNFDSDVNMNIGMMINLIGFNASIIAKGDIYRGGQEPNPNYWYNNSNTQWLTQANTTLTKNYSQWISQIPNDNNYASLMNTKYNSLNTSLTNSKMTAMVQAIQGAMGFIGGAGNMFYGGYKKMDYMFSLGAYGVVQGAGGMMQGALTSSNARRNYNSYLLDSVNANSGYVFQSEIPTAPVIPTATQVVLNKMGQVLLWNWVNRNGYDINEVFSARHINVNNMKWDKYLDVNNTIQNLSDNGENLSDTVYRKKYGYLKFYEHCTENIRQTIIRSLQNNNYVIASNHVEWWTQLLVNGFSFNTTA